MTTLMVPMGPVEFSPADVALILAVLAVLSILACLPVSVPLALYGARRARRTGGSEFLNGAWYWLVGTALTLGVAWFGHRGGLPVPLMLVVSWLTGGVLVAVLACTREDDPGPRGPRDV